ncbi:hypothetical protein SRABI70_02724 [Pseudomonas sp. Bi70]|nr:hypothetical protein SRABI70_02724 [Pseudomonas sp. Bi70]
MLGRDALDDDELALSGRFHGEHARRQGLHLGAIGDHRNVVPAAHHLVAVILDLVLDLVAGLGQLLDLLVGFRRDLLGYRVLAAICGGEEGRIVGAIGAVVVDGQLETVAGVIHRRAHVHVAVFDEAQIAQLGDLFGRSDYLETTSLPLAKPVLVLLGQLLLGPGRWPGDVTGIQFFLGDLVQPRVHPGVHQHLIAIFHGHQQQVVPKHEAMATGRQPFGLDVGDVLLFPLVITLGQRRFAIEVGPAVLLVGVDAFLIELTAPALGLAQLVIETAIAGFPGQAFWRAGVNGAHRLCAPAR